MADGPIITATIREPGAVTRQLQEQLDIHTDILAAKGVDFDRMVAQRSYEAEALRSAGITLDISEAEPGFTAHLAQGDRLVFHGAPTEPRHITSVTVALGSTLCVDVRGGTVDNPDAVVMTLRANGGTAIGVPTVAVDQLRAAGLVL